MDIEELSKSQIILLTLLVSFVTSIATGIVTVSLMEQAPPAIAQTVNRVVERTVEKVVPAAEGQTAAVVTTEKTIVVKESDLIVQALEKMRASLVRVESDTREPAFLSLGVVLDESGTVLTELAPLGEARAVRVVLADGSVVKATIDSRDSANGIAVLQSASTTAEGVAASFVPASFAIDVPVLGQTVVALSGKSIPRIADGLVAALIPRTEAGGVVIDTNISAEFIVSGSPLMNTDGALIGVSTAVSRASSQKGFIAASALVQMNVDQSGDE